jgi:hypothetical protein
MKICVFDEHQQRVGKANKVCAATVFDFQKPLVFRFITLLEVLLLLSSVTRVRNCRLTFQNPVSKLGETAIERQNVSPATVERALPA